MNYLLDTCVLSEARKRNADRGVAGWLGEVSESRLYLSVIALGEIQKGIAALADRERKRKLQAWLENDLRARDRASKREPRYRSWIASSRPPPSATISRW